jgi:hypothetical protein
MQKPEKRKGVLKGFHWREPMISKFHSSGGILARYCNKLRSNLLLQRLDANHSGLGEFHNNRK